ncbi:hypothetical protein BDZ89DRAFT_1050891 [Hymenopellis radicata]|nr:hypothetical protein BDZ89DRAFT_1050891 [Hymenopellis radicata]
MVRGSLLSRQPGVATPMAYIAPSLIVEGTGYRKNRRKKTYLRAQNKQKLVRPPSCVWGSVASRIFVRQGGHRHRRGLGRGLTRPVLFKLGNPQENGESKKNEEEMCQEDWCSNVEELVKESWVWWYGAAPTAINTRRRRWRMQSRVAIASPSPARREIGKGRIANFEDSDVSDVETPIIVPRSVRIKARNPFERLFTEVDRRDYDDTALVVIQEIIRRVGRCFGVWLASVVAP